MQHDLSDSGLSFGSSEHYELRGFLGVIASLIAPVILVQKIQIRQLT